MAEIELNRRELIVAGAVALTAGPAWAAESGALHFLAIGDFGRDGQYHQRDVAEQMGKVAAQVHSSFVLTVGDNFYPDGVRSLDDPKWRTSFEDVYVAPSLQTPWYAALGNHDYHVTPQVEVDYTRVSKRWRMPSRYYSVPQTAPDGATVEFFVLDTSPMLSRYQEEGDTQIQDQDVPAQLAWLDRALGASKADWKIVTAHHPVFSGGEHGDTPDLIKNVLPLLKHHDVPLFLNGHDHDLQHIERDGITFVCTGAGSKTRPSAATTGTRFHSDHSGFTAYALTRSEVRIRFIDYTGAVLHEAKIARAI